MDIFFSICQTVVDGELPSERQMFQNFFSQIDAADTLGFGTAWVAETHLSCQVQKQNQGSVIPDFEGEIGLNTDILQLAHLVFARTKRLHVGSAIRNILCNGGPLAHAEAIKTFLTLHEFTQAHDRKLEIGFAAGRFPFSNTPYGIVPRNDLEKAAWPVLKNLIFQEATEIFLRFLKGEQLSSKDFRPKILKKSQFRSESDWKKVQSSHTNPTAHEILIPPTWNFEKIGIIPQETSLDQLQLTIGTHDRETQKLANEFLPVGVFNLSITPAHTIEETHEWMKKCFNQSKGLWTRSRMPRTVLIFIDPTDSKRAHKKAQNAIANYWKAMEGTLDQQKIDQAVENALSGTPNEICDQIHNRFHPDDRLMLWFDFNNHNNREIIQSMELFSTKIAPQLKNRKPQK
jgi:alkanesulfonate monooxygenase SsuD/methylene tetrahydromethanopterin reductase-like flavin-dependent oxidoreductase (luciferase family)